MTNVHGVYSSPPQRPTSMPPVLRICWVSLMSIQLPLIRRYTSGISPLLIVQSSDASEVSKLYGPNSSVSQFGLGPPVCVSTSELPEGTEMFIVDPHGLYVQAPMMT